MLKINIFYIPYNISHPIKEGNQILSCNFLEFVFSRMENIVEKIWDASYRHFVLSSPEHEVLMVSYCDRAVSVARHQLFTLCTL